MAFGLISGSVLFSYSSDVNRDWWNDGGGVFLFIDDHNLSMQRP